MLLLTSVPHSGTRFFQGVIGPDHVCHVHAPEIDLRLSEADIIALAVRRPEDVWQSFWNRGEGLTIDFRRPGSGWLLPWRRLHAIDAYYKLHPLPVDLPDRQDYLDALAEITQQRYKTDWSSVGASTRKSEPAPPCDFDWIYEIPIINRLYGKGERSHADKTRP